MPTNPRRRLPVKTALAVCAGVILFGTAARAAGVTDQPTTEHFGRMLFGLVIVLTAAKLGGDLMERIGQPSVLGELIFGIVIGNLYLLGIDWFDFVKTDSGVRILSEVGVVLLLFEVGLESDIKKMASVGASAFVVATLGVIAPFLLGWGLSTWLLPQESVYVHVFIGATLCATSVGITARVMMDLGWIQTQEARIILGAAVVDDVQGLIVLAVVTGLVKATAEGAGVSFIQILLVVLKATLFLVGAIVIGRWISPRLFNFTSQLKARNLLLTTALAICFAFAYLADLIGLAPIVGAFAAGLILEEVHWRKFRDHGEHSVQEQVEPLVAFMAPVFFVVMGASVTLSSFARTDMAGLAIALLFAAIVGKQACSLGVLQKGLDRLSVGIGMIPRGEVGLIFVAIGSQLKLDGHPVVEPGVASAVVMVVVITTLITPPALKWSVARNARIRRARAAEGGVVDGDSGNE